MGSTMMTNKLCRISCLLTCMEVSPRALVHMCPYSEIGGHMGSPGNKMISHQANSYVQLRLRP